MEGYLASWGFLITRAGSTPTAVSALRPSKGVGKGPVPRPSGGAGIQAARPPVDLCVPGRRRQRGGLWGMGLALITRPGPRPRFMRASHAWDVSGSESSLSPRVLSHVKSEFVPAARGEESRQPECPWPCLEDGVPICEGRAGSSHGHPLSSAPSH